MLGKKDYEGALRVQDACNLAGVVRSFRDALFHLLQEADSKHLGRDFVHQHPITHLYVSKIEHLTGYQGQAAPEALKALPEIVGVVVLFRYKLLELCQAGKGTNWVNTHPECAQFCSRLMELSDYEAHWDAYARAEEAVRAAFIKE